VSSHVHVVPAVPVPDTPEGILDYLVRRTADTIGVQADRSDAVVAGVVTAIGWYDSDVPTADVPRLRAWLSGEAGGRPKITVHRATVQVEEWLLGSVPSDTVELVSVSGRGPAPTECVPLLQNGDRGVMFLRRIPRDLPYVPYLPPGSFEMAQAETGAPVESQAVRQCAAAVRWYAALPKSDPQRLQDSLRAALSDPNRRISRYAIRRLAQLGQAGTADGLRSLLPAADGDMWIRLMLGLFVLGERDEAHQLLRKAFRDQGEESWLGQWGLRRSFTEDGSYTGTLFGPAPDHMKGD
jgi:hypothetical protein